MTLHEYEDVLEYKCTCSKSIVLAKDINSCGVFQLKEMLAATFERFVFCRTSSISYFYF